MKCNACKTNIASGPEATKMIVQYLQDDGSYKFFGYLMEDGPLARATGRIAKAWHHKCYHVVRKREARGSAVSGGVVSDLVSVYELDINRTSLDRAHRLNEMLEVAREVGKPIGDPEVYEAYQARQHGGPYAHEHTFPLELYQLRAHLTHAHGQDPLHATHSPRKVHDRFHAEPMMPEERDWRDQTVLDIDDLKERP